MQAAGGFDFRAARIGIAAAILLMLGGCATKIPFQDAQTTRNKLGAALEVAPADIGSYTRCLIGKARGDSAVPRVEGVYVLTPHSAALLDYDQQTKQFIRAFSFDGATTKGVAIQEKSSIVGPLRQLQVRTDDAVLVMEFVNADHGMIGMNGKLVEAYQHLQSLGVPVMEPVPWVERPPVQPGTIYIPVYIPR